MLSEIARVYVDIESTGEEDLKRKLYTHFGHDGNFSDDVWYCKNHDGYNKVNRQRFRVSFENIPESFKKVIKLFILKNTGYKANTYNIYIASIAAFINFSKDNFSLCSFKDTTYLMLDEYKNFLLHTSKLSASTKTSKWCYLKKFYYAVSGFDGIPTLQFPTDPHFKDATDIDDTVTVIPQEFFYEVDKIFIDYTNSLPIHIQLIYWILRLIPSRINEVLNMDIDSCLRPVGNRFVITIPIPKTSPVFKTKKKMIYISGESDMELHLLNLLKKQIDFSKSLQSRVQNEGGVPGYLFTTLKLSSYCSLENHTFTEILIKGAYKDENFNDMLSRTLKHASTVRDGLGNPKYNLLDNEGVLQNITSHKLRHEGISERLDYGFQIQDVMFLSGLSSADTIWRTYYHSDSDRSVIPSEPIFQPTESNSIEDSAEKVSDTKFKDIESKDLDSIDNFHGAVVDDILLELNQNLYNQVPIVTSDGLLLGNCAGDYYSCKKIKNELYCFECEFCKEKNGDETVTFLSKAITRFESDVEFFKENGFIMSHKIAQERLTVYRNRLTRVLQESKK